jgi:hypothetical protein
MYVPVVDKLFALSDFIRRPVYSIDDWSGREDLNLRPPAPQAGALPGCATPRILR